MNKAIEEAVKIVGNQSALARACGVSQPTVN
ncbi:YdaS family helix-turn-helix protein [Pasteurella multocida]